LIQAGTRQFQHLAETTLLKFDAHPRLFDTFKFCGGQISGHSGFQDGFALDHSAPASNLELLSSSCTMTEFRSLRAKISWLSHSCPDIACAASLLAQVTSLMFLKQYNVN
jgi:hypothetical protein